MDDAPGLIDTAFWVADGKRADSGWEVLESLGLDEEAIESTMDEIAEIMGLGEDNCATRERSLSRRASYDKVCEALDEMASEAAKELEEQFEATVEYCRVRLAELRGNASDQ